MTHFIGVPPSKINIDNGLVGSDLGKSEKETIARNVIVMCRQMGDSWATFSVHDYIAACTHDVTPGEIVFLDRFVKDKLLGYDEESERYWVLDAFIAKLWKFVDYESSEEEPK